MTQKELLDYQLAQVGKQIDACLSGMPETGMDTICGPGAMSPRDLLEHLCEAYVAFVTTSHGEKHAWGSFKIDDKETASLIATFRELRGRAVGTALALDGDKIARDAYDYIVAHDNYHVGQMVLSRSQVEPGWDPFSIYA